METVLAVSFFVLMMIAPAMAAPSASSSPAPCPSATPTTAPAAPAARPCPTAEPAVIGRPAAAGRESNLVGTPTAAAEGTINQTEIANQPILRPGEILEDIPGLIISQHSGEGKANQYYLRGFQLDHGTDLAGTIDDIAVNMPSHAHGQGYSDI